MASILALPNEILEFILTSDGIKAVDIAAISQSCQRARKIVFRSATIWRRLYSVHFPDVAHQLENLVDDDPHLFWRSHFISRYLLEKEIRCQIYELSPNHYHHHALSNEHMDHFLELEHSHSQNGMLLVDALQNVVKTGDEDRDLTVRYYGKQVTQFVQQHLLALQWEEFRNREMKDQDLYQGLIMIAQWFQPLEFISLDRVKCDVMTIAKGTLEKLKVTNSSHPIFQLNQNNEEEIFVKSNIQEDRFGGGKNSIDILDALNDFMFTDSGFRGNTANYYNPSNSFIDKVLQSRQGIPITLCLLYKLVAQMLGVFTVPMNVPSHFMLKWHDTTTDISYYIDTFKNGIRRNERQIIEQTDHDPGRYTIATPMEIFQRMVRNLVTSAQIQEQEIMSRGTFTLLRSALELTKLIGGVNENPGFALCQIYLQLSINHREIIKELDNYENWPLNLWFGGDMEHLKNQVRGLRRMCISQIEHEKEERPDPEVKLRSKFSEAYGEDALQFMSCYSVGMVMKHKRYNYYCVINGWDPVCKATKSWIHQMGVNRLPRQEKQPFYHVLVEDGSSRYAADENLEIAKPIRITHPAIGRYFKNFHSDIGYEPNEELGKEYPEDKDTRERFYLSSDNENL